MFPSSPAEWRGSASPARRSQTDGCPPPGASALPGRWFPLRPVEPLWPCENPEWPSGPPAGPSGQTEMMIYIFSFISFW